MVTKNEMVTFVVLSLFPKKIYLKGNLAMTISSNRYLLIQLHFILNILVYYSLHSCCFFKQKRLKNILSSQSQCKIDYLVTLALFIAKFSVMLEEGKMFQN